MRHYSNNARWLMWLAPFKALSISAAYLVPFFVQHNMSQSRIFLLQSVFSVVVVLWEVPSGWVADRIGRARSICYSAPVAAASMIAYGFSDHFWQFAVCEVGLAIANGLISGADDALLIDSLKADGKANQFVRINQRIHSIGFAGVFACLPLSWLLVKFVSIQATLVADGLLLVIGWFISMRLVEPPIHETTELDGHTAWQATKKLFASPECRWLVALTVTLSSATYIGAWLAARYYTSLGIGVVWFGVLYAGRSLLKAWLSHHVHMDHNVARRMALFVVLAGLPYLVMATGLPWLAFAVFGHDIVHALQASPLAERYNRHMSSRHRAMLNSVVSLQTRIVFAVLGPIAGLLVDVFGLQKGFLILGLTISPVAAIAYAKLARLGSFEEQ